MQDTGLTKSLVITAYNAYDPTGELPRTNVFPAKVSQFVQYLARAVQLKQLAVNDAYREARLFGEMEYEKLFAHED